MSSSHTEGGRPSADAFVDDEVKAAEPQRRSQRENVSEAMLSISHQYTIDRLLKVEELLSTNRATVHQLSRADIRLLEAMDPDLMPASIKEKIKDVNQTVMMRIAAAEQGPQRVKEVRGDLFKAPENAVLIHACNTKGLWGMGIAAEFRDRYPAAHELYQQFCKKWLENPTYAVAPLAEEQGNTSCKDGIKPRKLLKPEGECFLIPPRVEDTLRNGYYHWIACLFTKAAPGRGGARDRILENTRLAIEDMKRQVEAIQQSGGLGFPIMKPDVPGDLWSCRLNSGLFRVHWRYTREVLEEADIDVIVVQP